MESLEELGENGNALIVLVDSNRSYRSCYKTCKAKNILYPRTNLAVRCKIRCSFRFLLNVAVYVYLKQIPCYLEVEIAMNE